MKQKIVSIFLVFLTFLIAKEIIIKGSDTMVNLVQQLAEKYMEVNPDATISVVGGGSGVGISGLIAGEVDIAISSREIKENERSSAEEKGVKPFEIPVAIDLLAVIVNEKNPVKKLTVAQLGDIFSGKITNWRQVGGVNRKVSLYGRQPVSGTFVFFREMVLKGDYSPAMKQMAGSAQIVEGVKNDVAGIGYVGLGYIRDMKGIRVVKIARDKEAPCFSPLVESDLKKYPIARPLYKYTNGKPKGVIRKFIEFVLSPAGQKVVEEVGFLPLSEETRKEIIDKLGAKEK